MASRVGGKIKLTSVEELLCVPNTEGTVDIDIKTIYPFENHPFKVVDDEKMDELVQSILINGILTPVLVRPDDEGTYEMISGHRRLHAAKKAGLSKIPAIIKKMTDDEATVAMVDANVQREEVLPSERAFALKMKMNALKRQGKRNDLTSSAEWTRLRAGDVVGEAEGISKTQVHKYIRLTELIPKILEMVDEKRLTIGAAADISFFSHTVQEWIYQYIRENGMIKQDQISVLKPFRDDNNMTQEQLICLLNQKREGATKKKKIIISEEHLNRFFPAYFSQNEMETIIMELLQKWKEEHGEI